MTGESVFLVLGAVLIVGVGGWQSVQLWRSDRRYPDTWPTGIFRAFPVMTAMFALFIGFAALGSLFREGGLVATVFGLLGAIALVGGTVLTIKVAITGRPSWLVPPPLRRSSGR